MKILIYQLLACLVAASVHEEGKEEKNRKVQFETLFGVPSILSYSPSLDTIRKKAPLNADVLAYRAGYSLAAYNITTSDGYHLIIHRLLPGQLSWVRSDVQKPVVLLQHGMAQSSSDWLINDSGKSFAMYLVDSGYDVWLGNLRGNKYSNSHVILKQETMEYYNFTFHEQGVYDIPATIDLVLRETQQPQLNYIGCSIGATVFFVAMSAHPEYASKVKFMGALSPLAFLSHTQTPIRQLAPHIPEIKTASVDLEVLKINPETLPDLINNQLGRLCFWRRLSRSLCNAIYKMLDDFGLRRIGDEHLDQLWKYIPTTTSAKTCIHLLQLMISEEQFNEYDYGPDANIKVYGNVMAPHYDLSRVRLPVAIFSGRGEIFTTGQDTEVLKRSLPLVVRHTEADSTFRVHTDFTHEEKAIDRIFKPMIFILNFFNQPPTAPPN